MKYHVFIWFRANPKAKQNMGFTLDPIAAIRATARARNLGYDANVVATA